MTSRYWYLATPYRKYPAGLESAYKMACEVTADLLRAGVPVFCPIAHGQGLADHGNLDPTDGDLWWTINLPLMKASRGLIVYRAEAWSLSAGMADEILHFRNDDKPIVFLDPDKIDMQFMAELVRAG